MACSIPSYARLSLQFPFVLLINPASCLIVDKVDAQSDSVQKAQIKAVRSLRLGSVIHNHLSCVLFLPVHLATFRGTGK